MNIAVLSLGQWIKSDITVLKRQLHAMVDSRCSEEEVWDWFKIFLPVLRLEQPGADGGLYELEAICSQFNDEFEVEVSYPQFLVAFNAMATISYYDMYRIQRDIDLLSRNPDWKMLLLSHTNHYHLQYILNQINSVNPLLLEHITVVNAEGYRPGASLLIASSMHLQTIEHSDTLLTALPFLPKHDTIVSFLNTLVRLSGYSNFQYHNPGKDFQYFNQHISPIVMSDAVAVKHLIVLRLGEFIIQDRRQAFMAFMQEINAHYQKSEPLQPILQRILQVQEAEGGLIFRFKMGAIEEAVFDREMIACISAETGVTISRAQFNAAWQLMNPRGERFHSALTSLCRERDILRSRGYEVVFMSYTNPKDIAYFEKELRQLDLNFTLEDGCLVAFAGFQLLTSYVQHKTIKQMLETLVDMPRRRYSPVMYVPAPQITGVTCVLCSGAEVEPLTGSLLEVKYWDAAHSLLSVFPMVEEEFHCFDLGIV